MGNVALKSVGRPAEIEKEPLTEVLRSGAKQLIKQAVEAELEALLSLHSDSLLEDGRRSVVRNGYLPERTIQTGIGDIAVQVPKVRDRKCEGVKFTSSLLPPYLKRTKSMDELIPWLYLKGLSTGDYTEALSALLGDGAKGLSSSTISRLKEHWTEEYQGWAKRDLSQKKYVYWWADGVYSNVRMDDRLCLLVIVGVTEHGKKELVAVEDGFRESTDSWYELLTNLRHQGLQKAPRLSVGDGALGFWSALSKVFPTCKQQRCWVHKTANVLNNLPKAVQPKVKAALHEIWMAESREDAEKAFDKTLARFEGKYPKSMKCLEKDRRALLTFYDFPAQHWVHIRTTNPIESTFATVRHRTKKTKNCGSRDTTLAMVFKLMQSAQNRWRKLQGFEVLSLVINNVKFVNGEQITSQNRSAA